MRISASDVNALESKINDALKNGEKYMVVLKDKNTLIEPGAIRFTKTEGEADTLPKQEGRFTKQEHMSVPVDDMKKILEKYTQNRNSLYQGRQAPDFYADTRVVKFQEVSRKELALQDVYRHLKVRGIEPDMKELRKQVFNASPNFTINGANRNDGLYQVKIEQNQDRSFHVHSVEPKGDDSRQYLAQPGKQAVKVGKKQKIK